MALLASGVAFLNKSLNRALAAASPSGFSHVSASLTISRSIASQFLTPVRLEVGYAIPLEGFVVEGGIVVGTVVVVVVDLVVEVPSRPGHLIPRIALVSLSDILVERIS